MAARISAFANTMSHMLAHPINRGEPGPAVLRYLRWQVGARVLGAPVVAPFVNDARLLVGVGMGGALYSVLNEYEEQAFVLHMLRPDDTFVDVGANIGVYTVLASAAIGATTYAFEPSPASFRWLQDNVALNNIGGRVVLHRAAAGPEAGQTRLSSGDTHSMNHVLRDDAVDSGVVVTVVRLDDVLADASPTLLKIDTEGFESAVLAGAQDTLANPSLRAIIIELRGLGRRYGDTDMGVHETLAGHGFAPFSYLPEDRRLVAKRVDPSSEVLGDTIYVRGLEEVASRVRDARPFRISRL